MISVKLIQGVFKRVERIVYPSTPVSTESIVERIMPMNSNIPEEIVVIQASKMNYKAGHIVNMEHMQYEHLQNTIGL